jgi:hypothetical protein
MEQIHEWFATGQVKVLVKGYFERHWNRSAIGGILGISKTRFLALLGEYPRWDKFSLPYREAPRPSFVCLLERRLSGINARKWINRRSELARHHLL